MATQTWHLVALLQQVNASRVCLVWSNLMSLMLKRKRVPHLLGGEQESLPKLVLESSRMGSSLLLYCQTQGANVDRGAVFF